MQSFSLRFVTYNSTLLQKFLNNLVKELKSKDCQVSLIPLPKRSKLITVIRSPFVNKKTREQFKLEVCTRMVLIKTANLLEIVQILKKLSFEGIAFKITLKGR